MLTTTASGWVLSTGLRRWKASEAVAEGVAVEYVHGWRQLVDLS